MEDDEAAASVPASGLTIADVVGGLREAGEGGRRVAVTGASHHVGATLTAVALARALAQHGRVILVDLALTSPNLAAFSTDPSIPGVADLVRGTASFGQIITRDKLSRVQIIPAGRVGADSAAMLLSERLAIALDALARSYDHVVIDAGAVGDFPAERMARFAPQAVLVVGELPTEAVDKACEELAGAGFSDVWLLAGSPPQPDETDATVAAA